MGNVTKLGAKIVFGALLVFVFVNMLGAGGPFANLTGMLISRYPFHRQIAQAFAEGLGYDISFIPAVEFSVVDDLIVLLVAIVISGGISNTLVHIFSPEGSSGLRSLATGFLSSIVTIFAASYLFGGIVQWMNQSLGGRIFLPILKTAILLVMVLIFYFFVQACARLAKGEAGLGLLGFFAIRSVFQTVFLDILSIYIFLSIINKAASMAVPLTVGYVVLVLVSFVGRSIGSAAS